MSEIPEEVMALGRARDEARAARDFARADELRDLIADAGFVVKDGPDGSTLEAAPASKALDPSAITDTLGADPSLEASFHLLHEGFPGDVERFLAGFLAHADPDQAEVVLVDPASRDGARLDELAAASRTVRVLHLDRPLGWAAARNAGLKTSRGRIVVLADLSIEPIGDLLSPLRDAFADPMVALAGPYGLVTQDMREFHEDPGPDVHAIEGYLLAVRREHLAGALIRERFTWYRNADIDLSFQVRARSGGRARVVDLPVVKHDHRGWGAVPEAQRAERSRKNHALFYRRWRDRSELLAR